MISICCPLSDEATALLGIDHVVLALPAGRMPSHVLFWRAVFGLVPQPQLDTADPYGLVHSRALVSPNGKVRIVLNASEGRGTLTGRFVSVYAGAGVHHVAFATPDIVRTAQELEHRHAPLLPMPSNYYDDLSARWALDDTVSERAAKRTACSMTAMKLGTSATSTPTPSMIASSLRLCSDRPAIPASELPMPLSEPQHRRGRAQVLHTCCDGELRRD